VTSEPRPPSPQDDERGAPAAGAPRRSWFGTVTSVLNVVGTVLILAMAVAVNADVIGRDFFNHPIPGVLEFISWSIVAIVFLQMANTLREGRHVSNDILMSLVIRTRPRLAAGIFAVFDFTGAVLMTIIVIYVWPILKTHYVEGYYAGTAGVVEIPIWPFMAAVLVGATATAVQFLAHAWQDMLQASGRAPVR
jgi:TRAP-type mannitol/chloroaromatic compound transport system permease small subunit